MTVAERCIRRMPEIQSGFQSKEKKTVIEGL